MYVTQKLIEILAIIAVTGDAKLLKNYPFNLIAFAEDRGLIVPVWISGNAKYSSVDKWDITDTGLEILNAGRSNREVVTKTDRNIHQSTNRI